MGLNIQANNISLDKIEDHYCQDEESEDVKGTQFTKGLENALTCCLVT